MSLTHRRLVAPLIWLLCALCANGVYSADKAQSQKQLESVNRQLKQMQAQLASQRKKRSAQERALVQAEQKIAELSAQFDAINIQLQQISGSLDKFTAERNEIAAQIKVLRTSVDEIIRQRYRMGEQAPLKLLLSQSDPQKVQRMMRYFDSIRAAQQAKLKAFEQLLLRAGQNNADIDTSQAALLKERSALQAKRQSLREQREVRAQALRARDRSIEKNKSKINKLIADKKRLSSVLARIEKIIPASRGVVDNRPFSKLKGALSWPIKGPVKRTFGSVENGISYDGIFIGASQGKPVKAVHSGHVVFADWLRSYGLVMIIDHGGGYLTLYGHNEQLKKKVGDKVNSKEVIGLVGSSGGNARAGLYFAIRYKGKTTNPRPWLGKR
ncbi:MAG: murein hydrolase activator EnvC family protein [Pseudomonadales bacterium]